MAGEILVRDMSPDRRGFQLHFGEAHKNYAPGQKLRQNPAQAFISAAFGAVEVQDDDVAVAHVAQNGSNFGGGQGAPRVADDRKAHGFKA